MNPHIAHFISAQFYGGKVESHASVREHQPPEGCLEGWVVFLQLC